MSNYLSFFKKHLAALIYGLSHSFFSSFGQTFFIGFYGAFIIKDFALTNTSYGSIYALATLLSSLTLSYFGELMDRKDYRYISIFIALGLGFSALSLSFTTTIWGLGVSIFCLRLFGQGLPNLHAASLMAKGFKKTRGKSLAITNLGSPLGEAFLPILLIQPLFLYFAWKIHWLIYGVLILLSFPLLIFYLSKHMNMEEEEITYLKKDENISRVKILRDKAFYLLIPTTVMNGFLLTAIFFNIHYIIGEKNWGLGMVSIGFLAFGLTRAVSNLYSGELIDRYSNFKLLNFYLIPILIAITSLIFPIPYIGLYIFFIFCGISVGFSSNLFTSIWAEIYGTKYLSTIKGLAGSCAAISTAISPLIMGWMMDNGFSLRQITIGMLGCIIFAYILMLKHPKKSMLY